MNEGSNSVAGLAPPGCRREKVLRNCRKCPFWRIPDSQDLPSDVDICRTARRDLAARRRRPGAAAVGARRAPTGEKLRLVVSWILSRAGLYVLLLAALALAPLVVDLIRSGSIRDDLMSPREITSQFDRLRSEAATGLGRQTARIRAYSISQVDLGLRQARSELGRVDAQLRARRGWYASIRPRAILERKELELRRTALVGLLLRYVSRARDLSARS